MTRSVNYKTVRGIPAGHVMYGQSSGTPTTTALTIDTTDNGLLGSVGTFLFADDFSQSTPVGWDAESGTVATSGGKLVPSSSGYVTKNVPTGTKQIRVAFQVDFSGITSGAPLVLEIGNGTAKVELRFVSATNWRLAGINTFLNQPTYSLNNYAAAADATYSHANGWFSINPLGAGDVTDGEVELVLDAATGSIYWYFNSVLLASATQGSLTDVAMSEIKFGSVKPHTGALSFDFFRCSFDNDTPLLTGLKQKVSLVWAAGQSNMVGSPTASTIDLDGEDDPQKQFAVRNPAAGVTGYFIDREYVSGKTAIAYRFLRGVDFGDTLPLVLMSAIGGTSFFTNSGDGEQGWHVGGAQRTAAIADVKALVNSVEKFGGAVIIWHLGETDGFIANGAFTQAEFRNELLSLWADLRAAINMQAPVVAGDIGDWFSGTSFAEVRGGISDAVTADPLATHVSSAGLTNHDGVHFDAASLRTLGDTYATALNTLMG